MVVKEARRFLNNSPWPTRSTQLVIHAQKKIIKVKEVIYVGFVFSYFVTYMLDPCVPLSTKHSPGARKANQAASANNAGPPAHQPAPRAAAAAANNSRLLRGRGLL